MKKVIIFLIFLTSCKGLTKLERNNIIYSVKSFEAEKAIAKKIASLKQTWNNVYIELEHNKEGYTLWLSPINYERKKKIQNLKLKNTGRVLRVDNEYYYLVFSMDESLGGYLKSIKDKKENFTRHNYTINDNSIQMKFDENWKSIGK